jgi:hypothetical protein
MALQELCCNANVALGEDQLVRRGHDALSGYDVWLWA